MCAPAAIGLAALRCSRGRRSRPGPRLCGAGAGRWASRGLRRRLARRRARRLAARVDGGPPRGARGAGPRARAAHVRRRGPAAAGRALGWRSRRRAARARRLGTPADDPGSPLRSWAAPPAAPRGDGEARRRRCGVGSRTSSASLLGARARLRPSAAPPARPSACGAAPPAGSAFGRSAAAAVGAPRARASACAAAGGHAAAPSLAQCLRRAAAASRSARSAR